MIDFLDSEENKDLIPVTYDAKTKLIFSFDQDVLDFTEASQLARVLEERFASAEIVMLPKSVILEKIMRGVF